MLGTAGCWTCERPLIYCPVCLQWQCPNTGLQDFKDRPHILDCEVEPKGSAMVGPPCPPDCDMRCKDLYQDCVFIFESEMSQIREELLEAA